MNSTAFCVCLCMLLLSCGSQDVQSSDTQTAAESTSPVTEAATEELTDGLENIDFNEADFNIVYSADQLGSSWPYDAEAETGDLLNDSVYKRNHTVMERFNVNVNYVSTGGTWDEVPNALIKSVKSGDNAYHLAISHTYASVPALLTDGYLADFNTIPNIDISKPWWNASIKNNLSICGVLPIAVSDLVYSYADVIYVNHDMIESYDLENPYDLVESGKWTWSKLAEMAEAVASDLNGDGKASDGDIFGYTTPGETSSLMSRIVQSNGMLMATSDDDGVKLLTVSDRLQNAFERYYSLLYYGAKTYIGTVTGTKESVASFTNGNILFMHQTTLQLPKMRDTDVNFGIVPLPKYDEAQENYASLSMSGFIAIPRSTGDIEMSGKAAELLSHYSAEIFTPAYYDILLDSKIARDEDSSEMLDIIFDSLVFDYGMVYGGYNEISYSMMKLLEKKDVAVVSFFEKNTKRIQKTYDKVYKAFLEFDED